jgi:RimJ/RimL family protein N-acetyltransferase
MNIQFLSNRYTIRDLLPQDAKMVCEVLKANTIFYKYHPPMVTVGSILEDMEALPPNKGYEDKHYIGFFCEDALVAVMDLIEDYPSPGTALLGFFAMNSNLQGQGIGTAIISDSVAYLAQVGFKKVRLGIDKGNPQSKAFWLKNVFAFTGEEYESDGSTILVMERKLYGYSKFRKE